MARIDWVEARLLNWARWKISRGGRGGLGYAAVDFTQWADMDTGRGSLYATATVPTNGIEASDTDDAVLRLPSELRATVEVVYLMPGGRAAKVERLACTEQTMDDRIWRAHRQLAGHWDARAEKARGERERVERLQEGVRPTIVLPEKAKRRRRRVVERK